MTSENRKKIIPKIQEGYICENLTVLSKTNQRKSGYMVWHCKCVCGREIFLDTRTLQRGTVRDCGCISKVKSTIRDLTGQRFGKLVCLYVLDKRDERGNVLWKCQCDCGNTCISPSGQLLKGMRKSCGCLGHPPLKDYIGKRFGRLVITEYAGKKNGIHRWKAICDCGNETVARQNDLQLGKTCSCGCRKKEIWEENMGMTEGTSIKSIEYHLNHTLPSNKSGHTGVYYDKKQKKWVAQITFQGKTRYLGSFEKKSDAIKVRERAEEETFLVFLENHK